jgi:hypothetical protein
MLAATSGILYARASLAPLARQIRLHRGVVDYLRTYVSFREIFVPHFSGARPFWRRPPIPGEKQKSNSGALGRLIAKEAGAVLSSHPSHCFAGVGTTVTSVLNSHTADKPCFFPVHRLAEQTDFSMLLIGCVDQSPGFSTVHVAQNILGLSQRHLIRYLLRWDVETDGIVRPRVAPEAPGCSESFDRFYPLYRAQENLAAGSWDGVSWLFVPSAKRALSVELETLASNPRFVKCKRLVCPTCTFRLY